jgi:60 kDa SS-A/Ro ribonucleoprotein
MSTLTNYLRHLFPVAPAPQATQARPDQVENHAGGFVFALSSFGELERFMILGCEGGSYYAAERTMTIEAVDCVSRCLAEDGPRTVALIAQISQSGRAPKNEAAILALAMATADAHETTRRLALAAVPVVCRTGTHLFHFVRAVEHFRKWGRGLRRAVGSFYVEKSDEALTYQLLKYQQRDGFTHRDVLRLAHPIARTPTQNALFHWVTQRPATSENLAKLAATKGPSKPAKGRPVSPQDLPETIRLFEATRSTKDKKLVLRAIRDHGFTHEMIPSEWKNDRDVWATLLEKMPLTALVRNLAKLTAVGLLAPLNGPTMKIVESLTNVDKIKKARLHPLSILGAWKVYAQGHGERGSLHWTPVPQIVAALEDAFSLAFTTLEPVHKRHLLALDVSGSMTVGTLSGLPGVNPRLGSAAMAMVTAKTEKSCHFMGFSHSLVELGITRNDSLDQVVKRIEKLPMGGTDCALPMLHAAKHKLPVDVFVVYTDNETWFGKVHPYQALRDYREKTGIPAKLAVVGMTATKFTIADPKDAGTMDFVGFDSAAPALLSKFALQ